MLRDSEMKEVIAYIHHVRVLMKDGKEIFVFFHDDGILIQSDKCVAIKEQSETGNWLRIS